MSEERKTRYHGRGIASRWSKRDESWHYTITYRWTPPTDELARLVKGTNGKPKKIVETVPADKKGKFLERTAITLKANRDRFHNADGWVPPHIKVMADAEHDQAETKRRRPLLYEVARDEFMKEEAKDYADGGNASRSAFDRLGLFFQGRMLDEVTRLDIREFFKQRASASDVYSDYKASVRSAETELGFLGALFRYLQDCGHAIDNPCHRPRTRKKDSPIAPYRVKHQKVTPGPETIEAIFTATKKAKPGANGAAGRELIRDEHRVLWRLCYHTAARPASEPCRLRHGDVRFLDDGWALVSYTDAKTASSNRTIPVPPECAELLRGIMLDAPTRFEKDAWETWASTPIFRKRRSAEPWDCFSYAKAWAAVVSVVPAAKGMWVRDFRSTAKTRMRKSNIRTPVAMAFMGHKASTVHDVYDNVDAGDLRKAAGALRLTKPADVLAASHDAT